MRTLAALAVIVGVELTGAVASGQQGSTEARAAAAALFDDARRLMAAGSFDEACPKLEESQRLSPGIGTLYNLADCFEKTGRTASAWTGFRDVVAQSSAAGQTERADAARERVKKLEPNLSRLRIVVASPPPPGIQITRDGIAAGAPLWGTPVPVDPGRHVVRATAPDRAPFEASVTVDGGGASVTVDVPALGPAAKGDARPAPKPDATPAPTAAREPPNERADSAPPATSWRLPVGIAALGVGVVGLGAGVALGFSAKSTAEDAACDADNVCTQAGADQRADAVARGNIATVVFVAGAALAVGGVALWWSAPSAPARPSLSLRVGLGPAGVSAAGRF